MPVLGSHFMILLGGMSEKTRKPLSLIQQQPSVHLNPLPSTSIFASAGTSLSNAGSSRSIEPIVLGAWAWAKLNVIESSASVVSIEHERDMMEPSENGVVGRLGVYRVALT